MYNLLNKFYYIVKPLINRKIQLIARRAQIKNKFKKVQDIWPILPGSQEPPENWNGWPAGKKFAIVLTHDIESGRSQKKCYDLVNMEKKLGFKSAFYFVPERYNVSEALRKFLISHGFEVGVHGLKHDGKLYFSRKIFLKRAERINHYLKEWQAIGFRSPAMHHNLNWLHDLDIKYDASTFDTDPFEPQSDGVNTIFPFVVSNNDRAKDYIELPYTLPQDSTLFLMLEQKNINTWKTKLDWIAEHGGMALLNTHPDYMSFSRQENEAEYPATYYKDLLLYIKDKYAGQFWHVLPREVEQILR